jgi:glycine hydroxymethyltransferase
MKESEMTMIAGFIADILKAPDAENLIETTRKKVYELCEAFPIYTKST